MLAANNVIGPGNLLAQNAGAAFLLETAYFTARLFSELNEDNGVEDYFSRATAKTGIDFEGLVITGKSGEAIFEGARRVENLIANASSASLAIAATDTITVSADTVYVFSMGAGAGTITFTGTATGSSGTLNASASSRTSKTLTITGAGTIIMTASVAAVVDYQIEDLTGKANQNPSEYVSSGVATGVELNLDANALSIPNETRDYRNVGRWWCSDIICG